MKNFLTNIRIDKIIVNEFVISFIVLLITIVFIAINYKNLPPFIPIFNQLPWGNQRLTPTPGIFIPVVLFFAVFIFNLIFSYMLYKKNNPLLGRIIAAVTLLIAVINLIFIIRTVLLVL